MSSVSFVVSNALKTSQLAQFVQENCLIAGQSNGVPDRYDGYNDTSIGFYLPTPRPHRKILGFTTCREWGWIGNIYTSNRDKGAHNKNWVMEVYGLENVDRLKALAEKIAQKFGVRVHVRLERQETTWYCPGHTVN